MISLNNMKGQKYHYEQQDPYAEFIRSQKNDYSEEIISRQSSPPEEDVGENQANLLQPLEIQSQHLIQTASLAFKQLWYPVITPFSPSLIFIIITWVLFFIMISQNKISQFGPLSIDLDVLISFGALIRELVFDGQVWRLVTASLLNQNFITLLINSLFTFFIVNRLENIYHPLYIALLMFVSVISGNTLFLFVNPFENRFSTIKVLVNPELISTGAAGATMGILIVNWQQLNGVNGKYCCLLCLLLIYLAFVDLFGWGNFSGVGALIGGFFLSLIAFPGLKKKDNGCICCGIAGLFLYVSIASILVFFA